MAPIISIYKFPIYRDSEGLVHDTRTADLRILYDKYVDNAKSNTWNRIWPFDSIIKQYCNYWINILSYINDPRFFILKDTKPELVKYIYEGFNLIVPYFEMLIQVRYLTYEDFIEFYNIVDLFYEKISDMRKKLNCSTPGIRITLARVKSTYRTTHPLRHLRRSSFDSSRWVVVRGKSNRKSF